MLTLTVKEAVAKQFKIKAPMCIHLVTVVSSRADILPQMLKHYEILGISAFHIHVHATDSKDPIVEQVAQVARQFDAEVTSTWQIALRQVQHDAWESRSQFGNDWCLIADLDEFQVYPAPLAELLAYCDAHGYEFVKGCFLDRIAVDGRLKEFCAELSIWGQYPMGAFLTYPILQGEPRKVVAAKSNVRMSNNGHHTAACGAGCPMTECLVQVHHFKWRDGLLEVLRQRIERVRRTSRSNHWKQSQRFIEYYIENGNRINLEDPSLLSGTCDPHYPNWDKVFEFLVGHGLT